MRRTCLGAFGPGKYCSELSNNPPNELMHLLSTAGPALEPSRTKSPRRLLMGERNALTPPG